MKLVSIVVPVYNSVEYLNDSVNSLLNQTYKNIQILLVDDGSTDGSSELCDELSKIDERICVIHKNNGGICSARNVGLDHVSGEYLMFCDNDDLYEKTTVEESVSYLESTGSDFVKFRVNYKTINNFGKEIFNQIQGYTESKVYDTHHNFIDNYIKIRDSKALTYIWNGIYKTSLIKDNSLRFDPNYVFGGEDFDFNYRCLRSALKVAFLDRPLYVHFKRGNHSTAAKYDRNQISSVYLNKSIEENTISLLSSSAKLKVYILQKYLVSLISVLSNKNCKETQKYITEQIKKYYIECDINSVSFRSIMVEFKRSKSFKRNLIFVVLKLKLFEVVSTYIINKRKNNFK